METKKDFTAEDILNEVDNHVGLHKNPNCFQPDEEDMTEEGTVDHKIASKIFGKISTHLSCFQLCAYVGEDRVPYFWDLDFVSEWVWREKA